MSTGVLEIDSVRKLFAHRPVLSDVWLKVETGEIVGLLGRNGSGKSTLLKIVSGNLRADQLHVKLDGIRTADTKNQIAYLSQDNFIPKQLRVEKAIRLSLEKDQEALFVQDDAIKSILGLKVADLSTGQRRISKYGC